MLLYQMAKMMSVYWTLRKQLFGWNQETARHVASHPVIIMLSRKLDAECDQQVTVISW